MLEFDEVSVLVNLSKGQIIEKFEHLNAISNDFEKSKLTANSEDDTLLIAIFWIGQKLRTSYAPNAFVLREIGLEFPKDGSDGSTYQ